LSYFWGSQDEKFDIILEGFPFQVGRNLFEALRCLRRETETLVIWVDALCINQQDVGERNAQVQLMGDIYRGAVTVQIWLGEQANESDKAIEILTKLGSGMDLLSIKIDGRYLNRANLKSLQILGNRAWWKRIWVIQEVILA
jgi:hypothetical protein